MIVENLKLFFKQLNTKTEKSIAKILFKKSMTISVTESCTGGLISSRLTDVAGSSAFIRENYVTYSNDAKVKLLGVNKKTLQEHGAVSEECVKEMAEGLFKNVHCDIALATTGLAGPGGATEKKKVGLLYIGIKTKSSTKVKKVELNPKFNRKTMKFLFSQAALEFLLEFLKENNHQQD